MVFKVAVSNRFQFKAVPSFRTMLFPKEGEIHYIGGADILPAPLDNREEARLIGLLGTEQEKEAKAALIEHNLRLVVYIAKKFDNTSVGVEDLISIGTEILMYLRRNNKTKMEVSIDEPLNVDWDGNELLLSDILGTDDDVISRDIENETEKSLLNMAIDRLNPREQKIIQLRYGIGREDGEELTQKEVADMRGISQSYISRLEKKIMKRLKKEMIRFEQIS